MASTRPAWASEMTSWTPDRPRAISERRKASQPAPSSAVATSMPRISRCPSALTPTAMSAWTLMIRPPSRTFWVSAPTQTNAYGPASRGRLRKAATCSSSHRADLGLGQLGDAEGLGELLDPAGGDAEEVGGGDYRDQGLLGPAASFQQPVREVAALPQLGDCELDGPGAGVPLARAIAVAMVDSFLADLPVFGDAEGVGFRRHERIGERLDHRAQQVRTRRGEIVFREGVQGQTVGCGHRADLLQRLGRLERSAGGRSHIRTPTPAPGQTPGSGGSPYTTSQDATSRRAGTTEPSRSVRARTGPASRRSCPESSRMVSGCLATGNGPAGSRSR